MLKIETDNYKLDSNSYENEIGLNGFEIYIDTGMFLKHFIESGSDIATLEEEMSSLIGYYSAGTLYGCTKEHLCKTLIYIGMPEFLLKKKFKYVFNLNDTLPNIIDFCEKNYITMPTRCTNALLLCTAYERLSKAKTYYNSMNQIKGRLTDCDKIGTNDEHLSTISSHYVKKVTGRYYTEGYNLQGWNKASIDCFTVPKDYYLIWADFSQIDFRVACNMILFNDNPELRKQFSRVDDKYEAFVRMLYKASNKEFNKDEFLANRPGYKTSVLAAMYGASENTISKSFRDPKCAKMLIEFFKTSESRNNYINKLRNALYYKGEVQCIDYFGQINRVPIEQSDNSRVKQHELKSINNNSIQSTSNSIIMTWCLEVIKRFRELGFGNDKFRAYLNRHDEMLFMAHKDTLPYTWILKDYSELAIDDWSILTVEPNFGTHYKVKDDELEKEYQKSCELNASKIMPYQCGSPRVNKYTHCKDCVTLYSLAPVDPCEFVVRCLKYCDFFKDHIDNLIEIRRKDIKESIKKSQELLRSFIENKSNNNPNNIYYELCLGYRYFSNNYYYVHDGITDMIKHIDLLRFLSDNNFGYVTIINFAKSDYILVNKNSDIQIRYVQESYYDALISKIPGYYDEIKSEL